MKQLTLSVALFAAACAAHPVHNNQARAPGDRGYYYPLWINNATFTPFDARSSDDAYIRKDLEFPLQVYGRAVTTVYAGMNGILSLSPPSSSSLTVPSDCFTNTNSQCSIGDAIVPFGRNDLFMPSQSQPGQGNLWVRFAYHIPAPSYTDPHHHFMWYICDKTPQRGTISAVTPCGSATRYFSITFHKNAPGVFILEWYNFQGNDWSDANAVVRVQAGKNWGRLTPQMVVQAGDEKGHTCVIFDTNKNSYEFSRNKKLCTLTY
ncbi:hypothetical protein TWF694_007839 [Orbilia ellipsospora]|uniref:Uncharacterized protein n=1 Tax=Orbilia ellipsospora TaxID=2528407 RepID=A0AAV9XJW1_9PEZI